jgi:hypothetical protein
MVMRMQPMVFCIRKTKVTGTVVNDRFVATSFELLPEQEIEHKSNVFNSSKYCQTHCTKSRRRSLFLSQLETHRFKAKTILLRRTNLQILLFHKFWHLKSFNINESIVEHTLTFACEGWWIGDMYSLISQKPAISLLKFWRRRNHHAIKESKNFCMC